MFKLLHRYSNKCVGPGRYVVVTRPIGSLCFPPIDKSTKKCVTCDNQGWVLCKPCKGIGYRVYESDIDKNNRLKVLKASAKGKAYDKKHIRQSMCNLCDNGCATCPTCFGMRGN